MIADAANRCMFLLCLDAKANQRHWETSTHWPDDGTNACDFLFFFLLRERRFLTISVCTDHYSTALQTSTRAIMVQWWLTRQFKYVDHKGTGAPRAKLQTLSALCSLNPVKLSNNQRHSVPLTFAGFCLHPEISKCIGSKWPPSVVRA